MNRKINLYYFGEPGSYDEYNPAYVSGKSFVPEVLYIIAYNPPFAISRQEIMKELKIDGETFDSIINSLKRIDAVDIREDKYKVNFTVFLERDIPLLGKHFANAGSVIGEKIIENSQSIYGAISKLSGFSHFSRERLLYHVICDSIFDGTAFDFFAERNVFSPSKIQPGDRDYIIFGFEDNEKVEGYINGLLCSSNNYRTDSFVFNSFGDSEGVRKDMFRFLRRVIKALEDATPFKDLNLAYIRIIESKNREIAEKCGELMLKSINGRMDYFELSIEEKNTADFLQELGYLNIDSENRTVSCAVPVFNRNDNKIIEDISQIILNDICETVRTTFQDFEKHTDKLTAVMHGIDMKEIAIELWHQVFGFANDYLVEKGFVERPYYGKEEGKFLRSFYNIKG